MLIEKLVIDYLKNTLHLDAVYAEEPDENITDYIVVEKTGSDREDYINTSTIAIKSYGETLYDAMCLNNEVKTAMDELWLNENAVSASELNSDYNFSDTKRHRYRYQAVYDITHYNF